MIGIIAAMEEEVKALKNKMQDLRIAKIEDDIYFLGSIKGREVVLIESGIGKVQAALNTTKLMERFKIKFLFNIGCAGSLDENIVPGSLVVADILAYHDLDVFDWAKGLDPSCHYVFKCDNALLESHRHDSDLKIVPFVSGDAFVFREDQYTKILKDFPKAKVCDMESCAIAHVAQSYKCPYIIARSISDVVTLKDSEKSYDFNLSKACENSAELCVRLIAEV